MGRMARDQFRSELAQADFATVDVASAAQNLYPELTHNNKRLSKNFAWTASCVLWGLFADGFFIGLGSLASLFCVEDALADAE